MHFKWFHQSLVIWQISEHFNWRETCSGQKLNWMWSGKTISSLQEIQFISCFRVPRPAILAQGTAAVMNYLRDRIPHWKKIWLSIFQFSHVTRDDNNHLCLKCNVKMWYQMTAFNAKNNKTLVLARYAAFITINQMISFV